MTKKTKALASDLELPGIFDRGRVPFAGMSLLEQLIAMKAALGPKPNKNELAAVLIVACTECGVRHKNGIVDLVSRAGLNPRHVGAILTNERDGAEWARWTRGADGRYQTTGG